MYHNNEKYMYTHMHVYSVPVVLEQVSLFSLCLRVAADGTRFLQKMGGYVNSLSGITELLEGLVHTTYMQIFISGSKGFFGTEWMFAGREC